MLPILKKKEGSVALPVPDHMTRKPDEEKEYDTFRAVAEDLINAIKAHDIPGCAEALKAAFEIADSEPHVEGPHMEGE
jgi:hypothetical protein